MAVVRRLDAKQKPNHTLPFKNFSACFQGNLTTFSQTKNGCGLTPPTLQYVACGSVTHAQNYNNLQSALKIVNHELTCVTVYRARKFHSKACTCSLNFPIKTSHCFKHLVQKENSPTSKDTLHIYMMSITVLKREVLPKHMSQY